MEEVQTQTSEVKEPNLEEQKPAVAEQVEQSQDVEAENSQLPTEEPDKQTDATLLELEEVLKGLPPEDVLKFQREISAELKQNLFTGEIGDLFNKYKPTLSREEQVKHVADLLRGNKKPTETAKPIERDNAMEQELLTAKIKLELVRQGVGEDYLEDATIVALSKVKNTDELEKCKSIAERFSSLSHRVPPQEVHSTIPVGEREKDMTEGEKAVAFLKSRNPKGFK